MAKNFVFIDSRVANYQLLISGFGSDTEWAVLDSLSDGISQMQTALAGRVGLDSIQIVSHGSPGALYLGNTTLTYQNLASHSSALSSIGASLTESGDLLLYGCNVGSGDVGLAFIESLAVTTGADVAASSDATGSIDIGGDWVLEQAAGGVEAMALEGGQLGELLASNTAPTFFVKDGKIINKFGNNYSVGNDIALQANGAIIIAGGVDENCLLARYDTNGRLDNTFGTNGRAIDNYGTFSQFQKALIQSDGKIICTGLMVQDNQYDLVIARYNSDGTIDNEFGTNGFIIHNGGNDRDSIKDFILLQDGKFLITGTLGPSETFSLMRLNSNGTLDLSFSNNGIISTQYGNGQESGAAIGLQQDGKTILGGSYSTNSGWNFFITRQNPDGSHDNSFGLNGYTTTNFHDVYQPRNWVHDYNSGILNSLRMVCTTPATARVDA